MTIARQRLCKIIHGVTLSTVGYPLLGNGSMNTFLITEAVFFLGVRAEES
jgi:hypothetical protein